jgi:hypothetical protein
MDKKYVSFKSHYKGNSFDQVGIVLEPSIYDRRIDQLRRQYGYKLEPLVVNLYRRTDYFEDIVFFMDVVSDLEYIDELTFKLLTI